MNTFFNQAQQTQKEHSNDNGTIAKKKKKKLCFFGKYSQ